MKVLFATCLKRTPRSKEVPDLPRACGILWLLVSHRPKPPFMRWRRTRIVRCVERKAPEGVPRIPSLISSMVTKGNYRRHPEAWCAAAAAILLPKTPWRTSLRKDMVVMRIALGHGLHAAMEIHAQETLLDAIKLCKFGNAWMHPNHALPIKSASPPLEDARREKTVEHA